jgi:hypothetical protein
MVAVLTGLAAMAADVTLTAPAARAVSGDGSSRFVTYNMHGSDNGSVWTSTIEELTANNAVVMLQEAGSGPPMPRNPNQENFQRIRVRGRPPGFPEFVTWVIWPGGPNGSNRYVYFLQTDPRRIGNTGQDTWQGGLTNLAIVTDSPADQVRVIENPAYNPDPNAPGNRYRARPLLGLRFGNTWYWNIHARGDDVPGLLNGVRNFANNDHRNWVLAGDFNVNILNRSDQQARTLSLHLAANETLLRTGQPTYIAGNNPSELDYAIRSGGPPGFTATIPGGHGSDHVPVHFARTPPPAQAPRRSHAYSTTLNTTTGRRLQENPNRSFTIGNSGSVVNQNQTFRMYTTNALTYYLQNIVTGDCVSEASISRRDVSPGTGAGSGTNPGRDTSSGTTAGSGTNPGRDAPSSIVAGACDDPRSQWTISNPEEDPAPNEDNGGPQRWRNVAFPDLCLTPGATSVTAAPCTDDPTQRWWDSSTAIFPWNWETATVGDVRLESAYHGRLGASGVRATTAPAPPRPLSPYWQYWEPREFGWNIQRISPDDNLVRIQQLTSAGFPWCLGNRNDFARTETDAVLQRCNTNDPTGSYGAGMRWLAETYPDGTIRFRNQVTHLCLLAPDGVSGPVRLEKCEDTPAQRWSVVNP